MLTPNELVFTFGFFYVCANFDENPSRNASVGVHADGHTDRGKLVFIIFPMLYAIAMGMIPNNNNNNNNTPIYNMPVPWILILRCCS